MRITQLDLMNFRNYEGLHLVPGPGTNILYGQNAQGKTNVLESIYMCGTARSHRTSRDKEMIRFGEDESHIRMLLERNDLTYRIDMHLKKNQAKGIAINGVPIRRVSELYGLVNIIFFSPEDLGLIKRGPAERRRFIDFELCQLDKVYTSHLVNYNKVLGERNQLLKDIAFEPSLEATLSVWDQQLIRYGTEVIRARERFTDRLKDIIKDIHSNITGGREVLEISYEADTGPEEFADRLLSRRDQDLRLKTTCTGPHRDDLAFMIGGTDLRKFGSQGQQRTAALSLKLSEIEMVKQLIGDTPVLLLDDVLSELDTSRQTKLLSVIRSTQTFITCTGLDEFVSCRFPIDHLFEVEDGTVTRKNETAEESAAESV